jgi:hypothetical protein
MNKYKNKVAIVTGVEWASGGRLTRRSLLDEIQERYAQAKRVS